MKFGGEDSALSEADTRKIAQNLKTSDLELLLKCDYFRPELFTAVIKLIGKINDIR